MTSWRPEIIESDHTSDFYSTSYPDRPTEPGSYALASLYRVVEWRDGAVFKTRCVRLLWVPLDAKLATWIDNGTHFMLNSPSTRDATRFLEAGQPVLITVRDKS